jgi:hypothetical protein
MILSDAPKSTPSVADQSAATMLDRLYHDVFLRVSDATTYVFLCGSRTGTGVSLRSVIESRLKTEPRIDMVFAEWVFASYSRNSDLDLLTLEHQLASSVDFIVIPVESAGTIAELGAFASVEALHGKTLVLNDQGHEATPSFINKGPIRAIKRARRDNIILFDPNDVSEAVDNVVSRILNVKHKDHAPDVSNLFGLSRFLLLVVALLQPVSERSLRRILTTWKSEIVGDLVPACLSTLAKKEYLDMSIEMGQFQDLFGLSETGFGVVHRGVLKDAGQVKNFAALRAEYIRARLKTTSRFNVHKEWERLLEV